MVRDRQNSAALENHLTCDDGGGHHPGIEFCEHLVGRRSQHAQVAGLVRAVLRGGSVGWPDVPKNIVKASRAETHSSGPRTAPAAVVLWTAARMVAHGSPSPNGMSVDSATFTPALQQ